MTVAANVAYPLRHRRDGRRAVPAGVDHSVP